MQWDVASNDTRVKTSCLIWNREEQEETTALMQRLAKQNELLHARVDHDRAEALKPGTSQHDYLSDLNASVTSHNTSLPRGQRQGRKNAFTVERRFKYEKLERKAKKGGLDFVWYAFNLYERVLFKYYMHLQRLNPGKDVYC
jgi:tRNA(Ile)-lysidine synthase TilS/MesJ